MEASELQTAVLPYTYLQLVYVDRLIGDLAHSQALDFLGLSMGAPVGHDPM